MAASIEKLNLIHEGIADWYIEVLEILKTPTDGLDQEEVLGLNRMKLELSKQIANMLKFLSDNEIFATGEDTSQKKATLRDKVDEMMNDINNTKNVIRMKRDEYKEG